MNRYIFFLDNIRKRLSFKVNIFLVNDLLKKLKLL